MPLPASTGEAGKRAAMIIDRIKRGEDPVLEPVEPQLTHSALAERFMRVHVGAHGKPDTAAGNRSVLEGHVLQEPGEMGVSRIRAGGGLCAAPARHAREG